MSVHTLYRITHVFFRFLLISLAVQLLPVSSGWSDDQLLKNSISSPNFSNAFEKDVYQSVKDLEYSDRVALEFVKMIRSWRIDTLYEKINQAAQSVKQKKISWNQYAQLEEELALRLARTIRKEISGDKSTFDLAIIVKGKKTQCLGYTQIFSILGNSMGLTVKAISVVGHVDGPMPSGEAHVACAIGLHNGRALQVDLTLNNFVSKSYIFMDEYMREGYYWILKDKSNHLKIHTRIQLLNQKGILAQLYNNRGCYYAKSSQVDKAISSYTAAITLNSIYSEAYYNRAAAYSNSGQAEKAISDCTKAIEINPLHADAYNCRGATYYESGRNDKALKDYTKAIEINPKFSEAYNNRGKVYWKLSQYDKAVHEHTRALELNPNNIDALFGRGCAYSLAGQLDKAIYDYNKVISMNPKYAQAYPNRAAIYIKTGKREDAINDLRKALQLNPLLKDVVKQIAEDNKLKL